MRYAQVAWFVSVQYLKDVSAGCSRACWDFGACVDLILLRKSPCSGIAEQGPLFFKGHTGPWALLALNDVAGADAVPGLGFRRQAQRLEQGDRQAGEAGKQGSLHGRCGGLWSPGPPGHLPLVPEQRIKFLPGLALALQRLVIGLEEALIGGLAILPWH